MPRPTALQIAQEFIEAVANSTSSQPDAAAFIASAKTNLLMMQGAPAEQPPRRLVNASGSHAMELERGIARARAITGLEVNNEGMLLNALCDKVEGFPPVLLTAPADNEPFKVNTKDDTLGLLLELTADLAMGRANMDTGIWWHQKLQDIEARLAAPIPYTAGTLTIKPAWLQSLELVAKRLRNRSNGEAEMAVAVDEVWAFLNEVVEPAMEPAEPTQAKGEGK